MPDSHPLAEGVKQEARAGGTFLRRNAWRLLLVFGGLLLPLWGFAGLAEELHEGEVFPFDAPLLQFAHAVSSPGLSDFFVTMSALGTRYGVIPFDALLILGLAWKRRMNEGLFAGFAIIGSALLNLATKQVFARVRPDLWPSIRPETSYSFPSGHAMGSMTLACVLVLLCWSMRWRWAVVVASMAFVVLVGASRVYLGVHYPSDIMAGWMAALAWTVAIYALVFRGHAKPWQ